MTEKLLTRTLSIDRNNTLVFENDTHNECISKDTYGSALALWKSA